MGFAFVISSPDPCQLNSIKLKLITELKFNLPSMQIMTLKNEHKIDCILKEEWAEVKCVH